MKFSDLNLHKTNVLYKAKTERFYQSRSVLNHLKFYILYFLLYSMGASPVFSFTNRER